MTNRVFTAIKYTALLLICYQPLVFADVYKWVDENGQVHYTDKNNMPKNITGAKKFSVHTNTTTEPRHSISKSENNKGNPEHQTETTEEKSPQTKEKLVEIEPSKADKKRYCQQAKNEVAAISSRGRMRELNEKGEFVYLSDKQRQQRLDTAKQDQRRYCR